MNIRTKYRRSLPSPFWVIILLIFVTGFCLINWKFLYTIDPVQSEQKSFESIIVEEMLKEMVPVYKFEDPSQTSDARKYGVIGSRNQDLETWMLNYAEYSMAGIESDLELEDWMIDLSSWSIN